MLAEAQPVPTMPTTGGTYIEGVVGSARRLNPLIPATPVDEGVARLVFGGLTRFDRRGEIVPDLARDFHVEQDGKVWTFEIREDATWHDGLPVLAADVVYTVGLLQDPTYGGPFAAAFRGVAVETIAPRGVRFTLPSPYGPFAGSTTVPLLPQHVLGATSFAALARHPFNGDPVGTGPFKVSAVTEREVVLEAHRAFHRNMPERARPYLDRFVLRSFADASEALGALARGEIDGIGGISSADAERVRRLRGVSVYSYPTNDFTALFLNVRPEKAVFRDRVVRQAIASAIDRGKILQRAIDGRGVVAHSFVPAGSWAYAADAPQYRYAPEVARATLDAADWKDHDGDGVRDHGGVALRFSIATSDEPQRVAAGVLIVEGLSAIGIQAQLRAVPFESLVNSVAPQRAFDALLVGVTVSPDPDPYGFLHSTQASSPGANFSGYATLPLDRSLEVARQTFDREKRRELYAPIFHTVATEVPVVFLYFADYLYAQDSSVQGLKVASIADRTHRFWDVEDWYVRTKELR